MSNNIGIMKGITKYKIKYGVNIMGKTIREACKEWVETMNAIPHALLERAYYGENGGYGDGIQELTPLPKKHICDTCDEEFDKDFVEDELEENYNGEKVCPSCFEREKEEYKQEQEDGEEYDEFTIDDCGCYIEEVDDDEQMEYGLPMWGTLWNPHSIDEWWIENNLQAVVDCGFRIYETDEVGILLGIDGAGYDFFESHWIPLYKARGLKWHDEE